MLIPVTAVFFNQEAITDGLEIAVSPRSLHSELMCPICLDMLKNTMTTKECLHRFCAECIITALRSGSVTHTVLNSTVKSTGVMSGLVPPLVPTGSNDHKNQINAHLEPRYELKISDGGKEQNEVVLNRPNLHVVMVSESE